MRLIDADALIVEANKDGAYGYVDAKQIADAPTVDAMPVKHGRWINVCGYFTPGGDPVWQCSECGKGLHVYGIEASTYGSDVAEHQWVSCPNCGAIMDGERRDDETGER